MQRWMFGFDVNIRSIREEELSNTSVGSLMAF